MRTRFALAVALFAVLSTSGCSTYTLTRVTAKEAQSDFPEGATYRVTPPMAFLRHSSATSVIGIGKPGLELARWVYAEWPAIYEVPAGTPVTIERYVRFDQHGFYDCGWDGWRFAIASITEGKLRGTRFLIDPSYLNLRDRESLLLEHP